MTTENHTYRSIQPSVLRDAAGGDDALLLELLHIFLRIAPHMVETLEHAAGAADLARVEAASHDLKGTAKMAGAERLAELAQEIEAGARAGQGDLLRHGAALRAEFSLVVGDIQAYLIATMDALAQPGGGRAELSG